MRCRACGLLLPGRRSMRYLHTRRGTSRYRNGNGIDVAVIVWPRRQHSTECRAVRAADTEGQLGTPVSSAGAATARCGCGGWPRAPLPAADRQVHSADAAQCCASGSSQFPCHSLAFSDVRRRPSGPICPGRVRSRPRADLGQQTWKTCGVLGHAGVATIPIGHCPFLGAGWGGWERRCALRCAQTRRS